MKNLERMATGVWLLFPALIFGVATVHIVVFQKPIESDWRWIYSILFFATISIASTCGAVRCLCFRPIIQEKAEIHPTQKRRHSH